MISALVKYKTINQYLEAAGCLNRTGIEEFFILKFSELSVSTARRMEACQKAFYQINFITHPGDGMYWPNTRKTPQTGDTLFTKPYSKMIKRTVFLALALFIPGWLFSQQGDVISRLEVYNIETGERKVVYEENTHFEAPNWDKNGSFFVINSLGRLYKVPIEGGEKELIDTGFADKCNNDHGISPDGKLLVLSHYDQPGVPYEDRDFRTSRIYTVPIEGGTPKKVTKNTPSFWHGWSPDGQTLLYTALRNGDFDVYAISVKGGKEKRLTDNPGLDDGPEFSHDGQYIFYNSMQSGSMQIWRMNADGSEKQQLTNDSCSNWFPHPSPDGRSFVFLSYLEDQGDRHPPMKKVALRLFDIQTGNIKELTRLIGGQGTINVPSWSPGGKRFAFVSYETSPNPGE